MDMDHGTRVLLVRHAETSWSRTGRHTGTTDIPITDQGRRSLTALRHRLEDRRFSRVLTSPLLRARQTCEALGLASQATVRPELAEWDYGRYEGLTPDEIQERAPGWVLWDDGAPDGESPDDLTTRMDRLVADLQAPSPVHGDVLLIAHGHSLRALGARWIGQPVQTGLHLRLSTATLSVLGWHGGTPVIWKWNTS